MGLKSFYEIDHFQWIKNQVDQNSLGQNSNELKFKWIKTQMDQNSLDQNSNESKFK